MTHQNDPTTPPEGRSRPLEPEPELEPTPVHPAEAHGGVTPEAILDALSAGLAELVEGQRQFAEEFGLPYERVFTTGFEPFKGRETRSVLHEWLATDGEHAVDVRALLRDLAAHQWALLAALGTLMGETRAADRNPALARLHQRFGGRPRRDGEHSALPRVVAAYARAREMARQADTQQDNGTRGSHGHDPG